MRETLIIISNTKVQMPNQYQMTNVKDANCLFFLIFYLALIIEYLTLIWNLLFDILNLKQHFTFQSSNFGLSHTFTTSSYK